jgi:hypothetical protein
MDERIAAGESQDHFRSSLPLAYMTEFTWKVSLRSLLKFLKHLSVLSSTHSKLTSLYDNVFNALHSALSEASVVNYYDNTISYENIITSRAIHAQKHINYNHFTNFDKEDVVVNADTIMLNVNEITFGLRAQLVRSRSLMINDDLVYAFDNSEDGWASDNELKIKSSITSSKLFFTELVKKRNCMLAQRDLWTPILDLLNKILPPSSSMLPCSNTGHCPVHKDCMERVLGNDPGVPCPMHYFLHKDEVDKVKTFTTLEKHKIYEYVAETNRCKALVLAADAFLTDKKTL